MELDPGGDGSAAELGGHVWDFGDAVGALGGGEVSPALVPAGDGVLAVAGGVGGEELLGGLREEGIVEGFEVLGVNPGWVLEFLVGAALVDQLGVVG